MTWAHRIADTDVAAAASQIHRGVEGRIVHAGGETALLTAGRGGREWRALRYGMVLPVSGGSPRLVWSAQAERLETVEMWSRLVRQRFATPIDAYVDNDREEVWMTGAPAWMVGIYDAKPGRGAVTITEATPAGRRPVLLSHADAMAWLDARDWDAVSMLAAAPRAVYASASADVSAALSTEARRQSRPRKAA